MPRMVYICPNKYIVWRESCRHNRSVRGQVIINTFNPLKARNRQANTRYVCNFLSFLPFQLIQDAMPQNANRAFYFSAMRRSFQYSPHTYPWCTDLLIGTLDNSLQRFKVDTISDNYFINHSIQHGALHVSSTYLCLFAYNIFYIESDQDYHFMKPEHECMIKLKKIVMLLYKQKNVSWYTLS